MTRANGSFEVSVTPLPPDAGVGDPTIGSMALRKQFQGDLVGTADGQMLATRSPVQGSAAYVALDRVTGSLHGRAGSFSLLHRGMMDRGASDLSITVVPDSGTDRLTGLTGSLLIRVEGSQHFYEMDYSLPQPE